MAKLMILVPSVKMMAVFSFIFYRAKYMASNSAEFQSGHPDSSLLSRMSPFSYTTLGKSFTSFPHVFVLVATYMTIGAI
jgi:hypothetical protein